ncbi:MAG: hypothetical protein QXJ75_02030 [Candidatus Bathyarchaeia archaeon]
MSLSIATIALLVLSVMAALPIVTHASTTGTITLSSSTIRGYKVVQVTITDPDISTGSSAPPRVTVDKTIQLNYSQSGVHKQTLTQLPLYQISGGSWVAFVTLNVTGAMTFHNTSGIPSSAAAQEPTPPAESSANWDSDSSDGFTEGKEPEIGTGVKWSANKLLVYITASEGEIITFTYHDSAGSAGSPIDVTAELEYTRGSAGTVSLDRTTYAPSMVLYAQVADQDINYDPTAAESYTSAWDSDLLNLTLTNISITTFTETGSNTATFEGSGSVSPSATIGTVISVKYTNAAPSGNVTASASVATTTASISLDKAQYTISDKAKVTLVEPDLNLDKKVVDIISRDTTPASKSDGGKVYVFSEDDSIGSGIKMEESGKNTGIFTGEFKFGSTTSQADTPTIQASSNKKVTVLYVDAKDVTGTTRNVTATATFKTSTGTLALDRSSYSITSTATLTLTDPDLNTDSSTVQTISRDTDPTSVEPGKVYIYSTSSGSASSPASGILMVETGANTGVFTGTFTFKATGTTTQADSPVLRVSTGDTITALYKDASNANGAAQDITATATYSTTTGTIKTDASSYSYKSGTVVTVYVTDPDVNTNPAAADSIPSAGSGRRVTIQITGGTPTLSETAIPVNETGPNTGEFKGTYTFTQAYAPASTITVSYYDQEDSSGNPTTITAFASITSRTGSITLDKSSYPIGAEGKITLTEPDMNRDPEAVETVSADGGSGNVNQANYVDIRSTTDMSGITIQLTETGPNTGVFTRNFTMTTAASSAPNIKVAKGDTVYVRYNDEKDATGSELDVETTAKITATTGSVSLDKTIYPIYGRVLVTINDPDCNTHDSAADSIDKSRITIKTSTMSTTTSPDNNAIETGVNTGIFETDFTLSKSAGGTTVQVSDGDGLTVTYKEEVDASGAKEVSHTATAAIRATTATITFDKANYELTDTATITLTEPDDNQNYKLIETPVQTFKVYSDTDPAGISLTMTETGPNTGIFTGSITFSTASTSGTQLKVTAGDTITAQYKDYTIPGYSGTNPTAIWTVVKATATVGVTPTPEMPAETTGTTTKDSTGVEKTAFTAGETALLSATVKNAASTSQTFLIAIQVMAPDGTAYPTDYVQTTLAAGQEFTFSPSFILPADAQTGTWTFEVSVFDNFPALGGVAVADPVTQTFTVE